MKQITVQFTFHSGIKRKLFRNVRLTGSWNSAGQFSSQWSEIPMATSQDEAGCDAFLASVSFDAAQQGTVFQWGVLADTTATPNTWVIPTEIPDENSDQRHRSFTLRPQDTQQHYWFATGRRFGAQKYFTESMVPGIRFTIWAPDAQNVEVAFAPFDLASGTPTGYIADDGSGLDLGFGPFPLFPRGAGIWETDLKKSPALAGFADFQERLYMYRITNEQGVVTYKTDIFSRNQVGRGSTNPAGAHYSGSYLELDGIVSCSVVSDPDLVTADFNDTGVQKQTLIPASDF